MLHESYDWICEQIVNPILLCDWSKENEIFDSCQVLSQHESEILNDLDQRLSFPSRLGASGGRVVRAPDLESGGRGFKPVLTTKLELSKDLY